MTEGRLQVKDFIFANTCYRLINVYAPNGESESFFQNLPKWCDEKTFLIGDLNVVLTEKNLSKNNAYRNDTSRTTLKDI